MTANRKFSIRLPLYIAAMVMGGVLVSDGKVLLGFLQMIVCALVMSFFIHRYLEKQK